MNNLLFTDPFSDRKCSLSHVLSLVPSYYPSYYIY